jgi:hypothetical protein
VSATRATRATRPTITETTRDVGHALNEFERAVQHAEECARQKRMGSAVISVVMWNAFISDITDAIDEFEREVSRAGKDGGLWTRCQGLTARARALLAHES